MRIALLTALFFVAGVHGWADTPTASSDSETSWFSLTGRDKFIAGNQDYRSNDVFLDVDLPHGFDLNADYNFYESDVSSFTQGISVGGNATWENALYGVTYAWNPLQNDSESHSLDIRAAVHTDNKEFRTTVGGDVLATDNFQYIRLPATTSTLEVSQRAGTLSLKQQLFSDTRLSVDLTGYEYNTDILIYSLDLARAEATANRQHPRIFNGISSSLNGANGLISGFPDWSVKFGASQDVDVFPVPVTFWGNYQNTHILPAYVYAPPALPINSLVTGVTVDSFTLGADAIIKSFTLTAQYNHVRQTGQTIQDLYGASVAYCF